MSCSFFAAENENLYLREKYHFSFVETVHFGCKIKFSTFFVCTVFKKVYHKKVI